VALNVVYFPNNHFNTVRERDYLSHIVIHIQHKIKISKSNYSGRLLATRQVTPSIAGSHNYDNHKVTMQFGFKAD